MKSVSSVFTDERLKQHPTRAKMRVTIQAYDTNGNVITDEKYDVTDELIGGLPEVKKELEDKLNVSKAGTLNLSFYDDADTIWDIFDVGARRWSLKVELTYDIPTLTDANNNATKDQPDCLAFSPGGNYLFVGCIGTGNYLQKFSVNSDGDITFIKELATSYAIYGLFITEDYVYAACSGRFLIYDHDLTLIGTGIFTGTALNRVYVSEDELHAWGVDPGANKVIYFDISTKATPVTYEAVTSIDAFDVVYFDNKIYILDYANAKLKVYDATVPATIPYSLLATTDLTASTSRMILDSERAIIYAFQDYTCIIDISDSDSPAVVLETNTAELTASYEGGGRKFKKWLFLHNSVDDKIYVTDLLNHYRLKAHSDVAITTNTGRGLVHNGDNILAYCSRDDDKIHTVSIWQDWVTKFEGLIHYHSVRKKGRNVTYMTAHSGKKELDNYNAELVYDANGIYLRNITGLSVTNISGGTTGAKTLGYRYKTSVEGATTIETFTLQYESGEECVFRYNGSYTLKGSSGQELTVEVSDTDDLPRVDCEDILVVGDTEDVNAIGYWYESKSVSEIVGYLLDESDFAISNRTIDVDVSGTALEDIYQFDYRDFLEETSGDKYSYIEENPPNSSNIIASLGTQVFRLSYDSATKVFSETALLDVTGTFAGATRVQKLIRLPSENILVVCVSGTKGVGEGGGCRLRGIMEINNAGAIQNSWNEATLVGPFQMEEAFGDSVEILIYLLHFGSTSSHWERNAFYWAGLNINRAFYVGYCDIDDDPSTVYFTGIIHQGSVPDHSWVCSNIVYLRTWAGAPDSGDDQVWFLLLGSNFGADTGRLYRMGTGVSEEHTDIPYAGYTTAQTIRAVCHNRGRKRWLLITEQMSENKQYIFRISSFSHPPTGCFAPISYRINHPCFMDDWDRAYAFEMDSMDRALNLVRISWSDPNVIIESEISGFSGASYTTHPIGYLFTDEVFIGVAELGATYTRRFFIGINISELIMPLADFNELTIRQALDEVAIGNVCLWDRPELDTVKFLSRWNYTDSFSLPKTLYLPQPEIEKQEVYLAVEAKNTYYEGRTYIARYPSNFDGDRGDILEIDNRFITPINKLAVAKNYYDFFGTIRRIINVRGYFLIELELFDKITFIRYDISGNSVESIDTVLIAIPYSHSSKLTSLKLVELASTPFIENVGAARILGVGVC